jgi:hypothetical protein
MSLDYEAISVNESPRGKQEDRLATSVTVARPNAEGPQSAARRNTGKHSSMLRVPYRRGAVCSLPS